MPVAPIPLNEASRLLAVRRTRLAGTPAEERFDRITRIARKTLDVRYAMIDLVAASDVWIKSYAGADRREADMMVAPRALSYCQHTITSGEPCLIKDARTDPRTWDLPWREEHVAYAGFPLLFEKERVGTFCVADTRPREFTAHELVLLREYAGLAESQLTYDFLSESQHALAAENERLMLAAITDPMTRAWNRAGMHDIAVRELALAKERGTSVGFVMLDVDHFKKVNDTHGHPAGDSVLRELASRVREGVRPGDALGRMGGEEFLVILPNAEPEEVLTIAERLRSLVARTAMSHGTLAVPVTVSLGVTCVAGAATPFAAIPIQAADEALYTAKRDYTLNGETLPGRNRVCARWVTQSLEMRAVVPAAGER